MRVIISAGGTGGHIYPALAILKKIKEKEPDSEFLYIGTHNRMEKDIVPKENIPYEPIEMYGFSKTKPLSNVKCVFCLSKGYKKCKKIMKEFKPDIVIGVGGYITVPVILAASKSGIPTFIHEQNSVPGKSNVFLSKYVSKIGVSFKNSMQKFPAYKTVFTGNPCSEEAMKVSKVDKKELGLSINKKLVLIVMGSLGASTFNTYFLTLLPKIKNKQYEIVFITGKTDYEKIKKHSLPKNIFLYPFFENLPRLMKSTDVMVSRAGASTLSEIIALGLPTILIPSPYVANNHQYKNAIDLVKENAALMLEEKDMKADHLLDKIEEALNEEKAKELKKNLKKLNTKDSALKIYNELKTLIDRK